MVGGGPDDTDESEDDQPQTFSTRQNLGFRSPPPRSTQHNPRSKPARPVFVNKAPSEQLEIEGLYELAEAAKGEFDHSEPVLLLVYSDRCQNCREFHVNGWPQVRSAVSQAGFRVCEFNHFSYKSSIKGKLEAEKKLSKTFPVQYYPSLYVFGPFTAEAGLGGGHPLFPNDILSRDDPADVMKFLTQYVHTITI